MQTSSSPDRNNKFLSNSISSGFIGKKIKDSNPVLSCRNSMALSKFPQVIEQTMSVRSGKLSKHEESLLNGNGNNKVFKTENSVDVINDSFNE